MSSTRHAPLSGLWSSPHDPRHTTASPGNGLHGNRPTAPRSPALAPYRRRANAGDVPQTCHKSLGDWPARSRQGPVTCRNVGGAAGAGTLGSTDHGDVSCPFGVSRGTDSVAAQCGCFMARSGLAAAHVPQMCHDLPLPNPAAAVSRLVRRRASAARREAMTSLSAPPAERQAIGRGQAGYGSRRVWRAGARRRIPDLWDGGQRAC